MKIITDFFYAFQLQAGKQSQVFPLWLAILNCTIFKRNWSNFKLLNINGKKLGGGGGGGGVQKGDLTFCLKLKAVQKKIRMARASHRPFCTARNSC